MIARGGGADEGSCLQRPAIGGAGIVYVISSSVDVVVVVDVVDGKLDVVGVAQGPVRSDELPAIAVVVGDGAVKDDETLRGGVVLAKLSKVQVGVKRVSLRCGGTSVDHYWLRRQGRRRWQRGWCLRGLGRGRAQAITKSERGRRAFVTVNEGRGGGHGADGDGGMWGEVSYSSGVSFIELCEELIGVDVRRGFPAVMCFREAFPLEKILQLLPMLSDLEYLFHFPFWLSIDKVWSGFLVFVAV